MYYERMLLGTLISFWDKCSYATGGIDKEHMSAYERKELFSVMNDIDRDEGGCVMYASVLDKLKKHPERVLLVLELEECMLCQAEPSVIMMPVNELLNRSKLKVLKKKSSDLERIDSIAEIQKAISNLYELSVIEAGYAHVKLSDVCGEVLSEYETPSNYTTYSSIKNIRKYLPEYKGIVIVAGRPATGKTAFAIQEAVYNCRNGNSVGFISIEMPITQVVNRMISQIESLNGYRIMNRMLTSNEHKRYVSCCNKIAKSSMFFAPESVHSIDNIERWITYTHRKNHIKLYVIDYFQIISGGEGRGEVERLSGISNRLARLQKMLDVPIILLCQLNRDSDSENRRPRLRDLKGTGSLEQDATVGMLMWNKDNSKEASRPIQILIEKSRHGSCADVVSRADFRFYSFFDMDKLETEGELDGL